MPAALLARLTPYLLVAAAAFALWWYIGHLQSRAEVAERDASVYEASNERLQTIAAEIKDQRKRVEVAARDREQAYNIIAARLRATQSARATVKQADPIYRAWADTKLPDVVMRGLRASSGGPTAGDHTDPAVTAFNGSDRSTGIHRID